jgi:hypothetical protein
MGEGGSAEARARRMDHDDRFCHYFVYTDGVSRLPLNCFAFTFGFWFSVCFPSLGHSIGVEIG